MKKLLLTIIALVLLSSLYSQVELKGNIAPLKEDTPTKTNKGNPFTAPKDWDLKIRDDMTLLEVPEGGSRIALIDVEAASDTLALVKALSYYPKIDLPLLEVRENPDRDGWSQQKVYIYRPSPNDKRSVVAVVMNANQLWTVAIYDMADDVGEKRGAQVGLIFDSLLPKGYDRESFDGRQVNQLDGSRIAELEKFIQMAIEKSGVPGVSWGVIQDGKVVYAGGNGVREMGKPEKVDENTLFLVASNTKALTTLLLARLVDRGMFSWDTPVVTLMDSFKLGDDKTTRETKVEHLICACTGMPRKDMEWLLEFEGVTPSEMMERLGATQPTSSFGELFQYSNSMAAAAGYVAGHQLFPNMELGMAYDKAMDQEVFKPLGMISTTFDFDKALSSDHASAHGIDFEGNTRIIDMGLNYSVINVRPAGAAWSNITDMLRYVMMELENGKLPNGERYIDGDILLERRKAKVAIGENAVYGMGLMVDTTYDIPMVHHGGDLFGHHSDMIWLPEHGVGAVVLTNGDPGWNIRDVFGRKLLELLFEGNPEADEDIISRSKNYFKATATDAELITLPMPHNDAESLPSGYVNESLGSIEVFRKDERTIFDFGEFQSEVGLRVNPDGTRSIITANPGFRGLEFVIDDENKPNKLILRDAQHEYIFRPKNK